VAATAGVAIAARRSGIVDQVDAMRIVVGDRRHRPQPAGGRHLQLLKFSSAQQSTCITQKPLVKVGDTVRRVTSCRWSVDADGRAGPRRNVLVAFPCVERYNFEDSILLPSASCA